MEGRDPRQEKRAEERKKRLRAEGRPAAATEFTTYRQLSAAGKLKPKGVKMEKELKKRAYYPPASTGDAAADAVRTAVHRGRQSWHPPDRRDLRPLGSGAAGTEPLTGLSSVAERAANLAAPAGASAEVRGRAAQREEGGDFGRGTTGGVRDPPAPNPINQELTALEHAVETGLARALEDYEAQKQVALAVQRAAAEPETAEDTQRRRQEEADRELDAAGTGAADIVGISVGSKDPVIRMVSGPGQPGFGGGGGGLGRTAVSRDWASERNVPAAYQVGRGLFGTQQVGTALPAYPHDDQEGLAPADAHRGEVRPAPSHRHAGEGLAAPPPDFIGQQELV